MRMKKQRILAALLFTTGVFVLSPDRPGYADPNCQTRECIEVRYEAKAKDDKRNKYCYFSFVDVDGYAYSATFAAIAYGQDVKGGQTDTNSRLAGQFLRCKGKIDCKLALYPISGTVDSYTTEPDPFTFKTKCTGMKKE
jgi:hypothetical protein